MNRNIWIEHVYEDSCPTWPCPQCHNGTMVIVPKSLAYYETAASLNAHSHPEWDPDWMQYSFIAWAKCSHAKCGQVMAISGSGGVEPLMRDNGDCDWPDTFYPKYCSPMPDLIAIPQKCPNDVTDTLKESFSLFWISTAACAGRIRVALESLMDHLGVPRKRRGNNGRFNDLTLHGRIDQYAGSNPTIGNQLMALKWLGNSGSHSSGVTQNDLLDAFEILEHVLAEIIDRRSDKVAKLAKALTKKHKKMP